MQILASALGAMIVLASLTSDPAAQERGRRRNEPPPELTHGEYKAVEFESEALERKARYGVYVPKSYAEEANKDRRYPLVIWLHGMFEDDMRFHNRGGSKTLDDLIGKGEVPELILVCPNAGRSGFCINGKNGGRGEDLVVKDLLTHLDATYRLEPAREKRAIMGVSMGGMCALKIAFRHPDLFGTVATHAAAVFPADLDKLPDRFKNAMRNQWLAPLLDETFGDPIDRDLWRENNPLALIEACDKEKLAGLRIYHDAGTADRYSFHLTNEMLHAALEAKEIPHTWRRIEGGGHSWGEGLATATLADSLRFVAVQLSAAAGKSALKGLLGPGAASEKKESAETGKEAPQAHR